MLFAEGRSWPQYGSRQMLDIGSKSSGFEQGFVAFAKCGNVVFPPPKGRNVNMMPFVFGDKNSLPENLQ